MIFIKTKILFGITLSEIGGAQKVVYDIISSISIDKYQITLITSPDGELIEWIEKLNKNKQFKVNIITIDTLKRKISPINDLMSLIKIYKIIRKGKFDIVHFHSSKMGILGKIAAYISKVKMILFTVHSWGINEYQGYFKRNILGLIERITNKFCHKIICVSKSVLDKGLDNKWIETNKSLVIYNGIEELYTEKQKLRNELNLNDEIIIGTVMRLRDPKMPIFTIKAFNELLTREKNIVLIIVGDGPLIDKCRDLIKELSLENKVFILGTRYDTRDIINDFDIFTLFSKWEGLPISILEAMVSENPIIANDVGGVNELVFNNINGYLINGFSVTEAVNLIYKLVVDKDLRRVFSDRSKEIALKNFSKNKMISLYEEIYSEVNITNDVEV